jgi:hypothetical protein
VLNTGLWLVKFKNNAKIEIDRLETVVFMYANKLEINNIYNRSYNMINIFELKQRDRAAIN